MKIILISAGNFQDYLVHNIKNLILHGNLDITVITERQYFDRLKEFTDIELIDCNELDDFNFNKNSRFDRQFRDGFWHYCSLRFFYLYSYIQKYNIKDSIHLENDTLLYENSDKLKPLFKNKVYAPFDSSHRIIPSFIYIPSSESFKPIVENYNYNVHDMDNLGSFDESIIEPLPIFPIVNNLVFKLNKNYNHNNINCIFDAAAIGQYLGGVDPRNQGGDTRGFVNETCDVKYNQFPFYWIKENNLYKPFISVDSKLIPIINLHIHSKELHKFLSDKPLENKYITIYNNKY
ncbi:MAG: hypothetical protein DCF19_21845 [Pseudanabaena frigida]|uniref:Glycosyl transferase n=1 Tax=Pseudanabaena frigida TaxID=945775 RepID=A0A2W4XNY7_9CYAN|nr:MAG: hypothetical protein DCF19_21845 [Pseudanabaena frigida]